MKKLLYLTLSIVMLIISTTGCGKKQEAVSSEQGQSDNSGEAKQVEGVDDTEADIDEMKAIYMDFIKGNGKATVKNPNIEGLEDGKEYSYDQMTQAYITVVEDMFEEAKLSDASFAFIDCGADGVPEFAINQTISTQMDAASMYSILKYIDGQLYIVSGRYGYYRSYVNLNQYGYITCGGSGGAAIFYSDVSYVNKDGQEIFLYSESDEMDYADSYISSYYFPGHEAPAGYPEELFSTGDDYITCVTYNFNEYIYDEEAGDDDYYKDNFYTFYNEVGDYHEPSPELAQIYKEYGISYCNVEEAEKKVRDHEASLGVTDQIRNGGEVEWISMLTEGIGEYSRDVIGTYGLMESVPGKWKLPEDTLTEGINAVYLNIDETGEFELNINFTDAYTAPVYAKGHLVLDETDFYAPLFYLYTNTSNFDQMQERTYEGGFNVKEYIVDCEKIRMSLNSDNDTFLNTCTSESEIVFEKAYSNEIYGSYNAIFNPSDEYYYSDYEENQNNKATKAVELKELSCTENEITDEDVWFAQVGMDWNGESYSDDKYTYRLGGEENYGTKTMLYIYDKVSGELFKTYDFHDFVWAEGYENNDFVDRSISYAVIENDILYVNLYHRTYAETCPSNAYVMAIDLSTGFVIWKTEPLVSNSNNFVIIGDNIITGYGFSAEDHYLSIIDKNTGKLLKKVGVKKSPEYFYYKDSMLYVRTYSYDYEFEVKKP